MVVDVGRATTLLRTLKHFPRETDRHTNMFRLVALGLVAFYVAFEVTLAATGRDDDVPALAPATAAGAVALASLAAGANLLRSSSWRTWTAPQTHLLVSGAALAWALDALDTFSVAYVATSLYLYPIRVAHSCGLVGYDPTTVHFVRIRSSLYATVRALTAVVVERAGVPRTVGRLVPFALAGFETVVMWVRGHGGAYTFAPGSRDFTTYTALKLALFVAVPRLEEAALAPPWW